MFACGAHCKLPAKADTKVARTYHLDRAPRGDRVLRLGLVGRVCAPTVGEREVAGGSGGLSVAFVGDPPEHVAGIQTILLASIATILQDLWERDE